MSASAAPLGSNICSTNNFPVQDTETDTTASEIYQSLIAEQAPEFFCDSCGFYPIMPVHGHFICPACKTPTKCCEGIPAD